MAVLISSTALLGISAMILVQIRIAMQLSKRDLQLYNQGKELKDARLSKPDYNTLYNWILFSFIFGGLTIMASLISFLTLLNHILVVMSISFCIIQVSLFFIPILAVFLPLKFLRDRGNGNHNQTNHD
ncbi:MAG: hypothetical protein MUO92_02945 [Dehalococcoidales bacterium]|nr:hypothetical protein [Dehalococcoidales bacterium]